MLCKVINSSSSAEATLVFLGWSTSPAVLRDVAMGENCYVFYDYTDLTTDVELRRFSRVTVVGWSMGVWAAEQFVASHGELVVKRLVAINGTAQPVDDRLGIPADIVRGTCEGWAEATRRKFNQRMVGDRRQSEQLSELLNVRTVEAQRRELQSIIDNQETNADHRMWDVAYIGARDMIFPVKNMQEYWGVYSREVKMLDAPHFPFQTLTDFSAL